MRENFSNFFYPHLTIEMKDAVESNLQRNYINLKISRINCHISKIIFFYLRLKLVSKSGKIKPFMLKIFLSLKYRQLFYLLVNYFFVHEL